MTFISTEARIVFEDPSTLVWNLFMQKISWRPQRVSKIALNFGLLYAKEPDGGVSGGFLTDHKFKLRQYQHKQIK